MNTILRIVSQNVRNLSAPIGARTISFTPINRVKEIRETKVGKTLFIEGVITPSPRENLLIKPEIPEVNDKKPCYMCALELDIKHTDVLILSQFLRSDGCMLPKRITGLCNRQQRRMHKLVAMAQKAGLMINFTPKECNKDPTKRKDWRKFNTYFDEKTIFQKKQPKIHGLMRYVNRV